MGTIHNHSAEPASPRHSDFAVGSRLSQKCQRNRGIAMRTSRERPIRQQSIYSAVKACISILGFTRKRSPSWTFRQDDYRLRYTYCRRARRILEQTRRARPSIPDPRPQSIPKRAPQLYKPINNLTPIMRDLDANHGRVRTPRETFLRHPTGDPDFF